MLRSAQRPGRLAEPVDVLLHGVADIDQRRHRRLRRRPHGVVEHPPDLGEPAVAGDAGHQPLQRGGVADEARGPRLAMTAKVDELHLEPARLRRRVEHRRLQLAGEVPGRLAAHGGVEREDEPPAAPPARGGRRRASARNAATSPRRAGRGALGPRVRSDRLRMACPGGSGDRRRVLQALRMIRGGRGFDWTGRIGFVIGSAPAARAFRRSSVVEQLTVNQLVVGSNPTAGANKISLIVSFPLPCSQVE